MGNVYLFCFLLGFGFTVISALLGGLLGGHGHGDTGVGGHDVGVGGHDVGVGGHDVGVGGHDGAGFSAAHGADAAHGGDVGHGDGDAGHVDSDSMHLPILSPMVLSAFLAGFGGSGLVYRQIFGERVWLHMPLAAATSAVLGVGLAWGMWKLTSTIDTNRMARESDVFSSAVEVVITVPKDGTGEITYVSGGTRQTLTARSADGREHKQGETVKVLKLTDGTAWVGEAPSMVAVSTPVADSEPSRGEPVRDRERH